MKGGDGGGLMGGKCGLGSKGGGGEGGGHSDVEVMGV